MDKISRFAIEHFRSKAKLADFRPMFHVEPAEIRSRSSEPAVIRSRRLETLIVIIYKIIIIIFIIIILILIILVLIIRLILIETRTLFGWHRCAAGRGPWNGKDAFGKGGGRRGGGPLPERLRQ
jgi:hypothetical protein